MDARTEYKQYQSIREELTENGTVMYAARLLQRAAQKSPDLTALIYEDSHMSYGELYRRACLLTQKLVKQYNIKPHDRVLVCFENNPLFYIAYFGVWQSGAVVAPLNTFLKEHELAHIIQDAKPTLIVTEADRADLFKKVAVDNSLPPIVTEHDFPVEGTLSLEECVGLTVDLPENEMSALLYTSGTTGLPKGVMLSSKNIMSCLMQGWARLQLHGNDRIFGVLPLFHVFAQFACVWGAFFVRATIILVPKIDRRKILAGLTHKPTIFLGVPALYGLLCLMRNAPLGSVNYFVSGGDAMPDKIRMGFALLYRRKIIGGYGLTETSPLVSVTVADEFMPTSCVGKPMINVEIKIIGDHGKEVPRGEVGVVWIKGDNVMLGYYNAPDLTEKVLKDEWFDTGDLGYFDSHGRLLITGRKKDLIIHKGFNIYPQEIENVIIGHPNVIRVGVIGVKDGAFGEEEVPVAYIQVRKIEGETEKEIKELCKQQLATYKIPRSFIFTTRELATTATGKVDKKVLRAQYHEEH